MNECFHSDPRIIAFGHTEELNSWLLMNTGNGPGLRKVSAWLKADRDEPEISDFSQYFAHCEDNNLKFLWHSKSLIKQQPQKTRVNKIKTLLDKFFCSQKYSEANLHKVLPDFLWMALLPWQLLFWQDRNCLHAENLYLNFCQKFLTSQPEIILAANFINSNSAQSLIADKRFKTIRIRYPALLWLFFREPVEMLFLYSKLQELSSFEVKMLGKLCEELKTNAKAYCSVTSSLSADANIMTLLVKNIDSQARFSSGVRLVVRKRLALLYSSWKNFYRQQKKEPLLKEAADVSQLLLKMHLKRLARKDKLDLTCIIEVLGNKKIEPHRFKELRRHPVLYRFLKEFDRKNYQIPRKSLSEKSLAKEVVSNLNCKTRSLAWLPQPGAAFLSALEHDWLIFDWARVLNAFSQRINLEPAQELMLFCLSHWAGRITAIMDENSLNKQLRFTKKRFATAFSVGYRQVCHESDDMAEAYKEDFYGSDNFEKWFLLLDFKAKMEIFARHEEFLLVKGNEFSGKESLKKNVMARQFYRACLAYFCKNSKLNREKKLFDGLAGRFLKNPVSIRKTAQALVPVYFLLTQNYKKMEKAISLVAHQLNNSQFVCEYIQTFVNSARVLRPINWHNSLDEQTYNSLVIGDLAITKSPALDEFVFNFVDDPENLKRAFLLKKKFKNLKLQRQPDGYT